ncbi:MAG: DoxX family protein [Crocinitomicaceae bacterium]|nr:DoxX family protein [Crocinitomicaceae bacterium]
MTEQKKSKGLHIGLWVVQILLALAFGMAGFMKLTAPLDQLAASGMSFVTEYSSGMVKFIGATELLAALGLILPAALRILPVLTPLAAVGLAVVMVLAANYHISHSEPFIPNIVFLVLALFVAWGRFKKAPVAAK